MRYVYVDNWEILAVSDEKITYKWKEYETSIEWKLAYENWDIIPYSQSVKGKREEAEINAKQNETKDLKWSAIENAKKIMKLISKKMEYMDALEYFTEEVVKIDTQISELKK